MPAPLPEFVQNQLLTLHAAGWSANSIIRTLQLSRTTVYRLLKALNEHGELYPPPSGVRGRPKLLSDEAEEDFILDEFDVALCLSSVWNLLRRRKWSRKKAEKKALERSEPLRVLWRSRRMFWSRRRLVFIDESGANERTGSRKYGWSPKGLACHEFESIKRSERWSILPAMTVDGYVGDPLIYQGGINAEIFCAWLAEDVLPQVPLRSILVMDNASIHRSAEVYEVVTMAGCELEFLPPYSPDLNPIELSFAILKAWIKRHISLATLFDDFGVFLRMAVQRAGGIHAAAHFDHSGYHCP